MSTETEPHHSAREVVSRADDGWGDCRPAEMAPGFSGLEAREYRPGSRPGAGYVRRVRDPKAEFRFLEEGLLEATPEANAARGGVGKIAGSVKRVLIGPPLASSQAIHERLTKIKALAVLSSDALSSVAYGTEAILAVLVLAGASALSTSLPIGAAIVALMIIVGVSYRQTIKAYPKGGGSYIVTKDNLGTLPGLLAGASLLVDYVLTVAVSVSAGVAAIISARQDLQPYIVPMGLAFIAFITIANLRGIRESGNIFAVPTYVFIVSMFVLIVAGFIRLGTTGIQPVAEAQAPPAIEGLTIFLILRAFASGCSAMTGVEAISDGVPAFKEPQASNARTTLLWMVIILATMFAGVTALSHILAIVPENPNVAGYETVLSLIAKSIFGVGPMYYVIQAATALILVLAANTSFSDFPRLSYFLARDGFMPHQYGQRGGRLAYSTGIITLGLLSGILLWAFNAQTDALIPLYAVGVFSAFTLSQSSMVRRWLTRKEPGWRTSWLINAVGACATGLVLVVIVATKFLYGAWIVCLLIPIIIGLFLTIHRHYNKVHGELDGDVPLTPAAIRHTIIVPVADLNRPAISTLAYARSISPNVTAVHIAEDEDSARAFRERWQAWGDKVPLVTIESPYRSIIGPLLRYIDNIDRQEDKTDTITVILPEYVTAHWWEQLLHNQTALRVKAALLFRPGTVVTSVPYHASRRSDQSPRPLVGEG
ncbi:MAG TPA: APC family permease [Chloroflexota bacterium]|nr:APC family permease [Chloroflexota bacterium]